MSRRGAVRSDPIERREGGGAEQDPAAEDERGREERNGGRTTARTDLQDRALRWIRGGVLLTFHTQHNAADMTGQGRVITYFARLLRGDELDQKEIET